MSRLLSLGMALPLAVASGVVCHALIRTLSCSMRRPRPAKAAACLIDDAQLRRVIETSPLGTSKIIATAAVGRRRRAIVRAGAWNLNLYLSGRIEVESLWFAPVEGIAIYCGRPVDLDQAAHWMNDFETGRREMHPTFIETESDADTLPQLVSRLSMRQALLAEQPVHVPQIVHELGLWRQCA